MRSIPRKSLLTLHTTLTGAWIGSVVAYLGLVVAALTGAARIDLAPTWEVLAFLAWTLIVPLALASLLSGIAMGAATPWGLFRHRWVVASLVLTAVAVAVLLGHMPAISESTALARTGGDETALYTALWSELLHSGLGLVVLVGIQTLNVYKPVGLTGYGRRKRKESPSPSATEARPDAPPRPSVSLRWVPWAKVVWFHALILVAIFGIGHVALGGLPH